MAFAEVSKFVGILSAALSQDHLSGFEIAQLEFHHFHCLANCEYPTNKDSTCNVGDLGSNPGLEKSPGEGNGNPRQYSCLGNIMDREAWWATVHGVAKRQT